MQFLSACSLMLVPAAWLAPHRRRTLTPAIRAAEKKAAAPLVVRSFQQGCSVLLAVAMTRRPPRCSLHRAGVSAAGDWAGCSCDVRKGDALLSHCIYYLTTRRPGVARFWAHLGGAVEGAKVARAVEVADSMMDAKKNSFGSLKKSKRNIGETGVDCG